MLYGMFVTLSDYTFCDMVWGLVTTSELCNFVLFFCWNQFHFTVHFIEIDENLYRFLEHFFQFLSVRSIGSRVPGYLQYLNVSGTQLLHSKGTHCDRSSAISLHSSSLITSRPAPPLTPLTPASPVSPERSSGVDTDLIRRLSLNVYNQFICEIYS